MSNRLYHFFPRKFENVEKTISIANSILGNGPLLSREMRHIDWKDRFAPVGLQRELKAEQFRFCLTAITNEMELKAHSNKFGSIALEFDEDFIVRIGGFPVFYVPTPRSENAGIEEYKGISLLYRLAEAQELLEYIIRHNLVQTNINIKNVLGSVKFLSNIFYPTHRKIQPDAEIVHYYNQREWRIIYNLTHENVKIGHLDNNPTIEAFENEPMRKFITKIIVIKNKNMPEDTHRCIFTRLEDLMSRFNMTCKLERIDAN